MTDDLIEIRERIEHCRDEMRRPVGGIVKFCSGLFTFREQDDGSTWSLHAKQSQPIPTSLKSSMGTIINELRACLDALACQLAIRNGRSNKRVYFPISRSADIFNDDGRKKIKKLSEDDQKIIADLKPFRGGNSDLFGLHELDRIRKHTVLGGAAGLGGVALGKEKAFQISSGSCTIEGCKVDGFTFSVTFDSDVSVVLDIRQEVTVISGLPKGLTVAPIPGICFLEPEEFRFQEVDLVLEDLVNMVEEIVAKFEMRGQPKEISPTVKAS